MTTPVIALVPAAGIGARLGVTTPKQYLPLAGKPMLYYSLRTLLAADFVSQVYVVLAAEDNFWPQFDWPTLCGGDYARLRVLRCGGQSRAQTVSNALDHIFGDYQQQHWVMVHDAARPCLSKTLLAHLYEQLSEDAIGGIAAVAAADTLKFADEQLSEDAIGGIAAVAAADTLKFADEQTRISHTVSRKNLWQAQTPQMFRLGMLRSALARFAPDFKDITDEASAIELAGLGHPRLVTGESMNFKVTFTDDIALAEAVLHQQETHYD